MNDMNDNPFGIDTRTMSQEQGLVWILLLKWGNAVGLTQEEIKRRLPELGKHYKDKTPLLHQTTLRKVRAIIRELRVEHGAPILSDSEGYWVSRDAQQCRIFLRRMEREVAARNKSSLETYAALSKSLGVRSKALDALGDVIRETVEEERE